MAMERLQSDSARELVDSVDHFIMDLDGVLWDMLGVIDGSPEAVSFLKCENKKILYASNNSTYTSEDYVEKFEKYGYIYNEEDVFDAQKTLAEYLKAIDFEGKLYVVGGPAIGIELDKKNFRHIGIGPDFEGVDDRRDTWVDTKLDPEVQGVVIGFDNYFSTIKIMKAISYLQKENSLFLITSDDLKYPGNTDILIPDVGALVESVKATSKRDPVSVGKPNKIFFDVMQKQLNLDPSKCCIVGDSLGTDIGLARISGMKSLLVLCSGVTTQMDVDQLTSGESDLPKPDYYTNRLGDLISMLT